jgi:hypothetical protein
VLQGISQYPPAGGFFFFFPRRTPCNTWHELMRSPNKLLMAAVANSLDIDHTGLFPRQALQLAESSPKPGAILTVSAMTTESRRPICDILHRIYAVQGVMFCSPPLAMSTQSMGRK